jgi:hypothetical protein
MDGAHQMRRAVVVKGEGEFSLGVGLGVANFLHPRAQFDQNDFVSNGWLAGRAIGDRAGKSSGERGRRE